jgi:hypothetical protein
MFGESMEPESTVVTKQSKKDLINKLNEILEETSKLSVGYLQTPLTHYDFVYILEIIKRALECEEQ